MADIHRLFEQAGITAEEFKKYFLDPLYPEKNPVIVNGVVYTEDDDGSGGIQLEIQAPVEALLAENPELFLALLRDKKLKEEIFLQWLSEYKAAHPSTQKIKPPKENIPAPMNQEAKDKLPASLLGNVLNGLSSVMTVVGDVVNKLLPRRQDNGNSAMHEERSLADEQKKRSAAVGQSSTFHMARANEQQIKEQTRQLAEEINIIDAVYDNLTFIRAVQKEAEIIAKARNINPQDQRAAQSLSQALGNPSQVRGIGVTSANDIAVQYRSSSQRQTAVVRASGRLSALRDRISRTAAEARGDSMRKALSDVGNISLGTGGGDANKVKRSATPNDKKRDDKPKELN